MTSIIPDILIQARTIPIGSTSRSQSPACGDTKFLPIVHFPQIEATHYPHKIGRDKLELFGQIVRDQILSKRSALP